MANKSDFIKIVESYLSQFPQNELCKKIDGAQFSMEDYHKILLMIFHQTFHGPSTFALAGAQCPSHLHEARDYLIHHADEEKSHWKWVISDLNNTGYSGEDPRKLFPPTACQAYIAYNLYVGMKHPLARLAIAAVLESVGATHAKKYSIKIAEQLKLKENQLLFFFGHGDTDIGHTEDVLKVIDGCNLMESEWAQMCHAAKTAGALYIAMYNEAAK